MEFDNTMKILEMDRFLTVLVVVIEMHAQALVPWFAKSATCIVLGCGLRRSERHRPPVRRFGMQALLRGGGRGTGSCLTGTSRSFQRMFAT